MAIGIFFGVWWDLYDHIPYLDKILHILGGITSAWFVLALMQREITHMAPGKQALILMSVTAFIGVAWEWAEFASNYTQYSHPTWYFYFHGGDLADTMIDFVADIAGALLFTGLALWKERSK